MAYTLDDLLSIMQKLRDPDFGCPWDLEQDFKSIAAYTIEEAYEVADAIQRGSLEDLQDELGDLLLQVVFHSQMASELTELEGRFDINSVISCICEKMIRRHPHVFSDAVIADAQTQTESWETIKAAERSAKQSNGSPESILETIPPNLPSLVRAKKLTKKAATVGFDWPDINSVLEKVDEELAELREAIASGNLEHTAEELGDLLFVITNVARKLKIDPDTSLRSANQKFIQRFHFIEKALLEQSKTLETASLDEMDALWDLAKLDSF